MARIKWDNPGRRFFHGGLDRGVFYRVPSFGEGWNGLISVDESPSDATPTAYYIDGRKYYNRPGDEEFAGTITCYTYPERLEPYLGYLDMGTGLYVGQQSRDSFDLCYRTMIGDDSDIDAMSNYQIHIIYNCLIDSKSVSQGTWTDSKDPINFSYSFTTTPEKITGGRPTSHLFIDSRETDPLLLGYLENILYGNDYRTPSLPRPDELKNLFDTYQPTGYGHGLYGHTTYGHGSEND